MVQSLGRLLVSGQISNETPEWVAEGCDLWELQEYDEETASDTQRVPCR